MDGITIIEEHLCRVVEFGEFIGFGIFITYICAMALLFYIWSYKCCNLDKTNKIVTIVCSILLIVINVGFWVFQTHKYNTTHMEYTVIVDDSVSFNDFHEKYEIVSVNGNEYRVVEKETT